MSALVSIMIASLFFFPQMHSISFSRWWEKPMPFRWSLSSLITLQGYDSAPLFSFSGSLSFFAEQASSFFLSCNFFFSLLQGSFPAGNPDHFFSQPILVRDMWPLFFFLFLWAASFPFFPKSSPSFLSIDIELLSKIPVFP